ncbi:MAG: type II toxin-antitoxin system prevent-host-death family antitoxin [Luteolibacter sp.]
MKTNVSTLLREFPKVRQAALSGEEVIIVTREGNLRLTAEPRSGESILGSCKGLILFSDDHLDQPTLPDSGWNPSL